MDAPPHRVPARSVALATGWILALAVALWPGEAVRGNQEFQLKVQWKASHRVLRRPIVKSVETQQPAPVKPRPVTRRASRETRFQPIIQAASTRYGVDPDLIRAVIHVESAYDPEAVSSKGAAGLMQLMPATADELGVADLFDPEHNIHGGAKYLKQLIRLFGGDRTLALAAYHAGITRVRKFRGIPPYKATHRYIQDVLTHYRAYKASRGEGGKSTV